MNSNSSSARAFTLLEVMLAVAIMALVGISIFQFVDTNVAAIRIASESAAAETAQQTLVATLQTELNSLPTNRPGALLGEAHKFGELPSDEMTWIATAGNGLFDAQADGEWQTTLFLKTDAKTQTSELGLRRLRSDADSLTPRQGLPPVEQWNWLTLLPDATGMEIRYFDPRLKAWIQKWTDPSARPTLVRVRIWRGAAIDPYETVLTLPAAAARE